MFWLYNYGKFLIMAWLFKHKLQVIPLQAGENADMYRQTLESAKIKLTDEEVKWLNLENN